jgi:transmembrane sensor
MTRDRQPKLNAQISAEAAEWFVEMRTGELNAAGRQQFDAWVRSSPEHLRAYLEIAAVWNEREELVALREGTGPLDELLEVPDNVVDLPRSGLASTAAARTNSRGNPSAEAISAPECGRSGRRAWMAAGMIIAALIVGTVYFQVQTSRSYATEVGEQRLVRLKDGSTVELNSRSQVRVRFSAAERHVDLLEGQALFHVAKDRARPFIVRSDSLQVRAVGTQFDVNRKPSGTVVTVLEGRVAVTGSLPRQRAESAAPVVPDLSLGAGEQVTLARQMALQPVKTNVSAATAWTQHRLVLDSAPLQEVADEFNRYSTRTLIVEDHGSEALRLSGVFATDPDFFIRYLRERSDITISETDNEIRITRHD